MISEKNLPPQNIEAEESILGGILLDPKAIGRVVDLLVPDAFYVKAHKDIYLGAIALHTQGKPTDLMTVTAWLQDHHLLEEIGGISRIAQLVDRTVSAVNIDRYAVLVMDKYIRRQLISAGHEIVDLGYDTTLELVNVLDESEKKVFRLSQERPQEGLVRIGDTLVLTFNEIEKLQEQTVLPGIKTDFYDLDALTSGFQRSDLIIIAGRPSMGKTSFALNIAYNIARDQLPVAIFSLEMSKEQLAQRLLASEAEIESNRLRSGRLSQNEWEPLMQAMGSLTELPMYIDDTANLTVTQMRSQVRRLQSEHKGQLGLVLIDYLQLMEGGSDNRVQELSKITRSLKGLAREINVPVIALSQLSRAVESRNNKRPMMSDLRESGCLAGDTLITLADTNQQVPIRTLIGQSGFTVWSLNEETKKLEKGIVTHAFSTGVKSVFCLKTRLGRSIQATSNHQFLTLQGWKRLDELKKGDYIALPQDIWRQYAVPAMQKVSLTIRQMQAEMRHSYCGTTIYKFNLSRQRAAKLASVVQSQEIAKLANSDIYWDEISSIDYQGETEVFDLTVDQLHNFVANDIIVHNSIEQDADLIIMLYRDEYYNQDSTDRGVAEVIVTKHRNGPLGTVKLLFKPELTKFLNMQNRQSY